jgi:hypothetical protein
MSVGHATTATLFGGEWLAMQNALLSRDANVRRGMAAMNQALLY